MKIKVENTKYADLLVKKEEIRAKHKKHQNPVKPNMFFRTLMRLVSIPDLFSTHFKLERKGMDRLPTGQPALVLMNHSSFIDLEIVARVMYPRPFNIVATVDGFIGKNWLMHNIGCIPTKKFVQDATLVKDVLYAINELKSSVVMFPEAGYTFDGKSTSLPDSLGRFVKMLGAPVVMITTYGAFARDPLYNNLQHRHVNVSATEEYLLSTEEIEKMSEEQINDVIRTAFAFDNFSWQQQTHVKINEPFRADYLNRVLYKCPACLAEGRMLGRGVTLACNECGKRYTLDEYGFMVAESGVTEFKHIPEWYEWQRSEVRREISEGKYSLDIPVEILATIDTKHIYRIGDGRLTHSISGFTLTGCDGELKYEQRPLASYTLNSDFNWYELGDMISIGNNGIQYYCFPQIPGDIVAKARLATEEIYKIVREIKASRRLSVATE